MANIRRVPEPEQTVAVLPDWVMLDCSGRSYYYDDDTAAVHAALKNNDGTTAVAVETSSSRSGYFSFTLAAPPRISYLDLHWPRGQTKSSESTTDPVYSSVLAADEDLLLLCIGIPRPYDTPHDLFVYRAAGPSPSLLRLPRYTGPTPKGISKFFAHKTDIGILRLAGDQDHYLVSELAVSEASSRGYKKIEAQLHLCVFSPASKTRSSNWRVFTKPAPQPSNGGRFPTSWLTSTVLPFDGRFLCWVDYLSGVLLSDFSNDTDAPALRFLPFPGKQYTDKVRRCTGRCCPDRYRSLSVSRGLLRFVDIDNEFHERTLDLDNDDAVCYPRHERQNPQYDCHKRHPRQRSGSKIKTWTLNTTSGGFRWELRCVIHLDNLWAKSSYRDRGIPHNRLPEFPVIAVDDPDLVWCLIREKEFSGKAWMIVVDMKRAELRSCTPYVNDQPYCRQNTELKNNFASEPPLPTVFPKYLNNPTGDTDKFTTRPSKKGKISM